MPRLRPIEGGGVGGLDPRRARLARIHDASILGLALSVGGFLVVGFFFGTTETGPSVAFWGRLALATLAAIAVMCVATVYMVAFLFDADPRTRRERRRVPEDPEPADPEP